MTVLRRQQGFTLIELLTVILVIAIVAAIGYPSYLKQVVKTRRVAAQACLLEYAHFMERYYTTNMSYAGATLPATTCQSDLADHYTFAFSGTSSATAYTIRATAKGIQSSHDAACSPLQITQTGTKSPASCWTK